MAPTSGNRLVSHFRRQDLPETVRLLAQAGRRCLSVVKVPGPLDKLTMGAVAALPPSAGPER